MEGRNQNYNWRNQEVAPTKRIQCLYGDTLSPKVLGTWGPSFSSKPWMRWFVPCGMEGSRRHPLSNWSLHLTVRYAINSITGTKVLHELPVARASLLMATGLGRTWVGKRSPFCSAWVANSAADAMSSIEEMFCGIMWLLAIVDDELCYKRRLPRIELLIFWTTTPPFVLRLYL